MHKEQPHLNRVEEDRVQRSQEAVDDILDSLRGDEWPKVFMRESIGGNAGANRAAINAYVERDTGRIIRFGNIQDLPKEVTSNKHFVPVTFLYNIGNFIQRLRNKDLSLEYEHFESVIAPDASTEAQENLNRAILQFNQELKGGQETKRSN